MGMERFRDPRMRRPDVIHIWLHDLESVVTSGGARAGKCARMVSSQAFVLFVLVNYLRKFFKKDSESSFSPESAS